MSSTGSSNNRINTKTVSAKKVSTKKVSTKKVSTKKVSTKKVSTKKVSTKAVSAKTVYIGLGSNIEQPYLQIKNAIQALNELSKTAVLKDSGYFSSKPMGPENQPDYVNAVVEIKTSLTAQALLKSCQLIEQQQGRIKTRRWGERTIDLDILLYADNQINLPSLTVPHPGICLRDFVYVPLLKLNPAIEIPGQGMLNRIVSSPVDDDHAFDNTVDSKADIPTDYACQFSGNINRED